jgi:hypothetical protein
LKLKLFDPNETEIFAGELPLCAATSTSSSSTLRQISTNSSSAASKLFHLITPAEALAEANSALQNLLYSVCLNALRGDKQVWSVLQPVVIIHTIAATPAKKVVNQILPGIDIVIYH